MNESSTFESNEWTWIFEKLKIFLPSLTGCQRRSFSFFLSFLQSVCTYFIFLSDTKDWSGFFKQRTQSLDYKTNTNPFPGCQNSIVFFFSDQKNAPKGNRRKRYLIIHLVYLWAQNIVSFINQLTWNFNGNHFKNYKMEKAIKLHNH